MQVEGKNRQPALGTLGHKDKRSSLSSNHHVPDVQGPSPSGTPNECTGVLPGISSDVDQEWWLPGGVGLNGNFGYVVNEGADDTAHAGSCDTVGVFDISTPSTPTYVKTLVVGNKAGGIHFLEYVGPSFP